MEQEYDPVNEANERLRNALSHLKEARQIQKRLSTGRPWGTVRFLERLEKRLKRDLVPGRPGPPKGRPRRR